MAFHEPFTFEQSQTASLFFSPSIGYLDIFLPRLHFFLTVLKTFVQVKFFFLAYGKRSGVLKEKES